MADWLRVFGDLWGERARVGLVALGVFWGTLSLSILLAFGRSMSNATTRSADVFGVDLLRIAGRATSLSVNGLPAGRSIGFAPEDAEPLARIPGVRGTCYEYSFNGSTPVEVGTVRRNTSIAGVAPGFGELRAHRARPGGRFLNREDHRSARPVCFLGARLARRLFAADEPVGRELRIAGSPFTVVGVGPTRITVSNYNGEDRDKLTMPASSFRRLFGWRSVSFLWIGLEPGADVDRVLGRVRRQLGRKKGFLAADHNALDIQNYVEMREMIDSILDGNRIFTAIVGLLGLIVSIVGVTNVMLALIEERQSELGVQLALGARPASLATDRVVEGVMITCLGGVAGLVAFAGFSAVLGIIDLPAELVAYLGRPRFDPGLGAGVLTTLVVAGALAGWLPARETLRLDPAQILREHG